MYPMHTLTRLLHILSQLLKQIRNWDINPKKVSTLLSWHGMLHSFEFGVVVVLNRCLRIAISCTVL